MEDPRNFQRPRNGSARKWGRLLHVHRRMDGKVSQDWGIDTAVEKIEGKLMTGRVLKEIGIEDFD